MVYALHGNWLRSWSTCKFATGAAAVVEEDIRAVEGVQGPAMGGAGVVEEVCSTESRVIYRIHYARYL